MLLMQNLRAIAFALLLWQFQPSFPSWVARRRRCSWSSLTLLRFRHPTGHNPSILTASAPKPGQIRAANRGAGRGHRPLPGIGGYDWVVSRSFHTSIRSKTFRGSAHVDRKTVSGCATVSRGPFAQLGENLAPGNVCGAAGPNWSAPRMSGASTPFALTPPRRRMTPSSRR